MTNFHYPSPLGTLVITIMNDTPRRKASKYLSSRAKSRDPSIPVAGGRDDDVNVGVSTLKENDQISSVAFNGKSFVLEPSLRGDKFDEAISSENAVSTTEHFSTSRRVRVKERTSLTNKIQKQLDGYFTRKLKTFRLPLHYEGTPFQMKVWNYLQTIPYGKTMSYQDVAQAIGHPKSPRAVVTACKRNPIPIIIPCHRVVRSSGDIGEYAGGTHIKKQILRMEQSLSKSDIQKPA